MSEDESQPEDVKHDPEFLSGRNDADALLQKDPELQEIMNVLTVIGKTYNVACDQLRAKMEEHEVEFPQEVAKAMIHLAAASASTINYAPAEQLGRLKKIVEPFLQKMVDEDKQ